MGNGFPNKLLVHANRHKETDGCRSGVSYAWRIVASAGVIVQSSRSGEVLKKTGGRVIWKQANKSQAVIGFKSNCSLYGPVMCSGRDGQQSCRDRRAITLPIPSWGDILPNKGLRLLKTAPGICMNREGKTRERTQRIYLQALPQLVIQVTKIHTKGWQKFVRCQNRWQKPSELYQG